MPKSRPEYLVSTDCIGFLGRPDQFIRLWKKYFDKGIFDGVEIIAFKPIERLKRLVSILRENNIPVLSFHGKTGGENKLPFISRIIMTVVNFFIIDVDKLLKNFPKIEFLSHAPYLEKNSVKEIVLGNRPKKIWIENHLYGKKGVETAIRQIIFFRKNGINTFGMLDVFHYVARFDKDLKINWNNIVKKLKSYILLKDSLKKQIFTGIHFPIGSRLGDSLPIDSMSDEMLTLFAEKIIPNVERIVFENQQKNLGLLLSTGKMLKEQKTRNKRIIERLKKTGVILI